MADLADVREPTDKIHRPGHGGAVLHLRHHRARLRRRNLVSGIHRDRRSRPGDRRRSRACPLPLHHVYPFVIGTLTPLAIGLPLVIPSTFTTAIPRRVAAGAGDVFPRLYEAMIAGLQARLQKQGRPTRAVFKALFTFSIALRQHAGGCEPSPCGHCRRRIAPDLRLVQRRRRSRRSAGRLEGLGWLMATGYGLAPETAALLTINRPGNRRFETAGHPVPGVALRIDREAAPPGMREEGQDTGEVLAQGPGVFAGYLDLPEQTAQALTGDGWFRHRRSGISR